LERRKRIISFEKVEGEREEMEAKSKQFLTALEQGLPSAVMPFFNQVSKEESEAVRVRVKGRVGLEFELRWVWSKALYSLEDVWGWDCTTSS